MKKKILAVLLVLCAVVLFALTASAATDTSVGYRVNVTLSADSYFCGTEGHTGEVTSISIKNVDSSKWDTSETRPLTVLFEVSFKCNTCGVSGTKIANNALSLTFRDANSCHAPFNASVTARNLLSGRDDSITFTLTRDKIGYAEKVEKKDATCTESGISQTCWECQGCKQIFSDENCTNKLANDISGVTIPASGHSLTHYEAQDANCQHDGWVEHWRCEKCNGYFLDAAGLNPTGSSSVMRYDRNKHVGETVYVPYNLEGKRNHKVYPSCHPGIFTTEPHVLGDSSKGEDPDCCALCGQIVAAKVLHSVDPYEKRFFAHDDAIADFNNSETSEEIHFLRSFDRTVSINKAGTVRLAEGKYITYMNVGDYDVTIWNDGKITNLNAYSSTTLRGSKTGTYGKITNRTEGGTVGDLLFRVNSNSAYYVTEDLQWISRAAASGSSISEVQVLYSPFTYIEITGDGVKEATDEADKYTLTAIRGDTVTLDVATYAVFPSMSADSSITWDYGGIPEDRVSVVRNVDWKDLRLTITDLPSGTYTLTFTRTAVNKFSVSSVLVLTVEETRTAHTVTFDPNGGTLNEDEKSKSVMPGDAYGALPTPTRDSHHFSGWYTAPVGGTKVDETTVVTELEDHTLYAHWTYYHEHCVCGGTLNHTHENVEWQAWDGKSEITYEQKWVQVGENLKAGRYVAYVYLTGNVSANLTVEPKHILYLCLNGYSFTSADPSQPAITLTGEEGKPAELDLCDCVGTGTLGGSNASGGSIRIGAYTNATLYGGTLTGNTVSGDGGAVSVTGRNSGFTMQGGTITGNSASAGGGIHATSGSVTINGGVISNNRATNNGGGIYASSGAKFHLNGGEIQNNVATEAGGGVYCSNLYSQNTGRCEFYGGTISGNTAKQGGGAYVRVCYIGYRNCRITDNTAAEAGGGLYLFPFASEKRIYMGNVYGSSGTIAPYIYDNTVNSAQNNLYLSDPDTQIVFTARINTDADAKLGVYFTGITQNGASVLLNSLLIEKDFQAKMYLDRIFCDNPEYGHLEMQNDNGYYNLYLINTASAVKVTFDPNGGTLSAGEESKLVQPDSPYGSLPTPTRADYRFDGWFTEKDGGTKVEETTIMSSRAAHTLYAHWTFLHKHCICGGDVTAGDHTSHSDVTYQKWDGKSSSISYTNNVAHVYLTENAQISDSIFVQNGKTLYLCLNGKEYAKPSDVSTQRKFIVTGGGHLILCDCVGTGSINCGKSDGGGGCVYLNSSTMDMYGGKFTGSSAALGGAIAVVHSTLNLYGGEISGNTASEKGGAVYVESGTVNISGKPVVKDNTVSSQPNNIYLPTGKAVSITGSMADGAEVGITTESTAYPVVFSNAWKTDYSEYFFADSANAHVEYNDDERLQLAAGAPVMHTHDWATGWSSNSTHHWHECTAEGCTITDNSQKDGYAEHSGTDDNNCTTAVTCECGYEIKAAKAEHNWSVWSHNTTTHTHSCRNEGCGTTETKDCTGGTATCTAQAVCEVCGGAYGELAAHSFTEETAAEQYLKSAATCTKKAVYYKSCSVCGLSSKGTAEEATFFAGNILDHDWGAWTSNGDGTHTRVCSRNAAHTETGNCTGGTADCKNRAICETCGGEYGEMAAHSFTTEKAETQYLKSAATCTEKEIYYKSCAVCGLSSEGTAEEATFTFGDILGHDWGAWTSNGNNTHTRVCSRDASHAETDDCHGGTASCTKKAVCEDCKAEYGDLLPHDFTAEQAEEKYLKSAATCTEKAVYYKSCTVCGEKGTETFEYGNPLGHDYGAWTSNDNGTHTRVCSRDASHAETDDCHGGTASCTKKAVCEDCKAEYGDLLPHDFTAEQAEEKYLKSAATCTEKAVYYKSCTVCGEKGTETFEYGNPLGHDYGAWTSNDNGTHTRTCSRNAAHTETGNCTGGTATCTAKAVCETCGSEYGEMKAHNFTAETAEEKYLKSAATCTEKAVYYKSCTVCGEKGTETFEYGNPLGHDYGAWTSNDNGTHTRVCSRDAIHTETENCSGGEATCTEQATCEFCGKKYGEPLGHTYKPEWITNEQRHWHVCARCDHIKDMGVHRFGEWSIVRRPTSTKTGERVRSCTICNYEETEELPVTGGYVLPYYKLTFETNGGSSLEPVVKIKGTVIDLAEYSAYRYGYTFDSWYADEALTQRVTSVTLDADKTVYAAWTRNRFFEDVTIADWFYDDVMFVCGRGVMQGVSDTRFGPHLTATRAMMATILWRMEGSPAPTAEARFTDVRSGQWYSEAVAWTAQSGVYTGYADGSFRPNDSITREQLAAILYRYAKYKGVDVSVGEDTNILSYADAAEISDYAFPAMQWACGAGVMQGSNGNLLPRGRATRAQIAAMLHRYLVK